MTTHFGDVASAWEKLKKDDSHGNYFVAKYQTDGDKVVLHVSGGDSAKESAHDACVAAAKGYLV